MVTSKIWFLASRPKTCIASISPVLIGTSMAMKEGFFQPWLLLFTLLTALGIQIGMNFSNDYFDFQRGADTQERKGPLRVTQAGLVTPKAMKIAISLVFAATLIFGSYLVFHGGLVIGALICLSLILGLAYTAGPYPIAYLGFAECLVVLFFGSIAVAGTYFLQTGVWVSQAFIVGLGPGLISSAILIANNLRDCREDALASKKTLVVRFGVTFGKIEYIVCILGAFSIPLFFSADQPFSLLTMLAFPPALFLSFAMCKRKTPQEIDELFAKTGKLLLLYTSLLCVGWML